jgi:zinc transport system ATP-binding protein
MSIPFRLVLQDVVAGHGEPLVGPFSMALAHGEVIGLTGANGVGKSTLVRALLGEARLYSGRIEGLEGARLRYLPQRPIRPEEAPLSGRELLHLMQADRLPAPARLAEKLDLRIDRLSGGEYQLLHLWCALAGACDLVLLDEPTNNLDAPHAAHAAQGILERCAEHATLLVSHDSDFLGRVCDRVLRVGA